MGKIGSKAVAVGKHGGARPGAGAPRVEPPTDVGEPAERPQPPATQTEAAGLIEDLAADGWSVVGIAWKLGISKGVFARWLREQPVLLEAFEVGRERERRQLHNNAYRLAFEGKEEAVRLRASMYLLNTRHGYAEPNDDGAASRFNITINLPGAMTPEQYAERTVNGK